MTTSVPPMSGGGTRPRQRSTILDELKVVQDRRERARREISKLSAAVVNDTRELDRLLIELGEEMVWDSLSERMQP